MATLDGRPPENEARPESAARSESAVPVHLSWRDRVKVHPAAELIPLMADDDLRELGEDIQANKLQSPVVLLKPKHGGELMVLDGRNRLDAMEKVGLPVIDDAGNLMADHRIVEDGGGFDAADFVVAANIRRRHLRGEQKRDLVADLLKANPEKSDRQIAETVKASPTTVGVIRAELEQTGDVSRLDTRTDTKGRKQPATNTKSH